MKISTIAIFVLITMTGLLSAKEVAGQFLKERIAVDLYGQNAWDVIKQLETQNIRFVYNAEELGLSQMRVKNLSTTIQTSVEEVLNQLLINSDVEYEETNGFIILKKKQQPGRITGRITNEKGEPLAGATVRVLETGLTSSTDDTGNYQLTLAPGNYTLEVSYISYSKVRRDGIRVAENGQSTVNVRMDEFVSELREVTVSYGKQRLSEMTGSVVDIQAVNLQDMPVTQFAQQLQGRVSGVHVAQTTGQPGRGMQFRIRGAASLSSSNQPLFVIDGMPITGSINNINPAEIESYSFLKDASASALYGSRAANGVVLITTKRAKQGQSYLTFNTYQGVQEIPKRGVPVMMTAREYAQYMKERHEDNVKYGYSSTLDPMYANPEQYGEGTNWFDVLTQTAPIQNYDLTLATNKENSSNLVVVGYQNQKGVVVNSGSQLFSLRLNQDYRFHEDKLNVGFGVAPSYRMDHNNRLEDGIQGIVQKTSEASPLISPYDENGNYTKFVHVPGMVTYINPLARYMLQVDDYNTTRILGTGYLNYKFTNDLTLKTNIGLDMGMETRKNFAPSLLNTNNISSGLSSSVSNYSYTGEAYLDYRKVFGGHQIDLLGGMSVQRFNQESNTLSGQNFATDDVPYLSQASVITGGSSNTTAYSMVSYIGRVNYNYRSRYLLSFAMRGDGSSRFGKDNRYGYFPSVSVGWNMKEEAFLRNIQELSMLKVRASYGIIGNNNIGNYTHISQIGGSDYVLNGMLAPGTTITSLGNSVLGWERSKQLDIGLDVSLFDSKLRFTYDYYNKYSDGLIQARPIPQASGYGSITSNVGEIKFWGHEFSLEGNHNFGKLHWTSSFNMSFDRNRIENLVSPGYFRRNNTISSDYFRNQVGYPMGMFYGFIFDGLYENEADLANSAKHTSSAVGSIKMKDINGDHVIDENDRTFIGDPNPDFLMGFHNRFEYGNFDLNLSITGSYGGEIIRPAHWAYLTNMDGARHILAEAMDRWRSEENPGSGKFPTTKAGTTVMGRNVNTQWVEDGSYLSLKSISLGWKWDLPTTSLLKNIRIYGAVQNVFFISNYTGMNPEISLDGLNGRSIGIDENAYPVPRTYSLGLNVTF